MKKMKFLEFVEYHKELTGKGLSYDFGTPGMVDLIRLWNTRALFDPDGCEDVVLARMRDRTVVYEVAPNPNAKPPARKAPAKQAEGAETTDYRKTTFRPASGDEGA